MRQCSCSTLPGYNYKITVCNVPDPVHGIWDRSRRIVMDSHVFMDRTTFVNVHENSMKEERGKVVVVPPTWL
jgi:hypothetical protein